MPDTTICAEFTKLIPVVTGGLLAVGGGLAGQVLLHYLTTKREADKLRRERLESLVKALFAHEQWLDARHTALVLRKERHDVASPFDEVLTLQVLHFPQLAGEVAAVREAETVLLKCMLQEVELKVWNSEPFNKAYLSYASAIAALTVKCRALLTSKS